VAIDATIREITAINKDKIVARACILSHLSLTGKLTT
jgi:hypothetical protein